MDEAEFGPVGSVSDEFGIYGDEGILGVIFREFIAELAGFLRGADDIHLVSSFLWICEKRSTSCELPAMRECSDNAGAVQARKFCYRVVS